MKTVSLFGALSPKLFEITEMNFEDDLVHR